MWCGNLGHLKKDDINGWRGGWQSGGWRLDVWLNLEERIYNKTYQRFCGI